MQSKRYSREVPGESPLT